jgi:hypothetical protein
MKIYCPHCNGQIQSGPDCPLCGYSKRPPVRLAVGSATEYALGTAQIEIEKSINPGVSGVINDGQ